VNAIVGPKRTTPPSAVPPKRRISDQEFLPAALEILETPPSPVRIAILIAICAFVTIALTWSYIGRIDIIAVAQGKLQPTGRVKLVQPLETSKVLVNHVENGRHVSEGEVLVELDPSEIISDKDAAVASLASYSAEVLRRRAAIAAAQARSVTQVPAIVWPADIPAAIRMREERVLEADLQQLNSQVLSSQAQAAQKQAEATRLRQTMLVQNELIAALQERVDMKATLVQRMAGAKADLINAVETLKYQQTTLAQQTGQLNEALANLKVIDRDIEKAYATFISENAQKASDAARQSEDFAQKLAKADARIDHMILRSPISGIVQASTITTVGQVVTSGEEIMRIVPENAALEIECYLPNKDIGFVKEGQEAVIKIDSFPFTRYGTIKAQVIRVAHDAIPEPDANQTESNGAKPSKSTTAGGGQRMQNLVFPVTLRPERSDIDIDGTRIGFSPGMAVSVEIRTGSRRILEYIFSPLTQTASEAMKER